LTLPPDDGTPNQVLQTDGSGSLAWVDVVAATATNVNVTANNSTDETTYLTFVDGATSTQGIETDTGLTYNPSTGTLTSTTFIGGLTGTATAATVANEATNVTISANNSTDETTYLTFVDGTTGTQGIETDTGLTYNPSTGALTASNISVGGSNNELRFYEGANYVGFEAPALSADQIWVLPIADGSSGEFLKTNGSGTLAWASASGTDNDGYNVQTINASASSNVIRSGAVTIPSSSIITKIRAVITTTIAISTSANVGLNLGTTVGGTEIVNDSSSSMGFGVSSVAQYKVYEKGYDNGSTTAYIASEDDVYFEIKASTGNITSGAATFIVEYIKF
jgi:hypothetical protein